MGFRTGARRDRVPVVDASRRVRRHLGGRRSPWRGRLDRNGHRRTRSAADPCTRRPPASAGRVDRPRVRRARASPSPRWASGMGARGPHGRHLRGAPRGGLRGEPSVRRHVPRGRGSALAPEPSRSGRSGAPAGRRRTLASAVLLGRGGDLDRGGCRRMGARTRARVAIRCWPGARRGLRRRAHHRCGTAVDAYATDAAGGRHIEGWLPASSGARRLARRQLPAPVPAEPRTIRAVGHAAAGCDRHAAGAQLHPEVPGRVGGIHRRRGAGGFRDGMVPAGAGHDVRLRAADPGRPRHHLVVGTDGAAPLALGRCHRGAAGAVRGAGSQRPARADALHVSRRPSCGDPGRTHRGESSSRHAASSSLSTIPMAW